MSPLRPDESETQEVMVELNTTPLIDVLLVLLVMLIISIPAARHAVNMALPSAASSQEEAKPPVVVLELMADQSLRWNGGLLTDNGQLQEQMQRAAQQSPAPVLHIRPHRQVPYSAVAHALATAHRQGLRQVALLDGFD
jgi:biopolymer transport protein ExbD